MGLLQSSSVVCNDCSGEPLVFSCEEDLDAHQLSVHWCMECVNSDHQADPFSSYEILQTHILCTCSTTSKIAGRTRGMSTYDSSTSSANMRKRFLPSSFEGHHSVGLTSDTLHSSATDERLTFAQDQTSTGHQYHFDVAVPGSPVEDFSPDDVMEAAVTCCFEAALLLLRGESVTAKLCDTLIKRALVEDGAERSRSISAVYMHDRYLNEMEVLVDKEVPLVQTLRVEHAPQSPYLSVGGDGSTRTRKRISNHERNLTELPPNWTSEVDAEGSKIYKHELSGKESWTPPPGSLSTRSSFQLPPSVDSACSMTSSAAARRSDSVSSILSTTSSSSSTTHVDCFDMTNIAKLKEYSKTTPLVAILTRSRSGTPTTLVISFDQEGHATMFIPWVDSAKSCVFFGFKAAEKDDDNDMLALQLKEEFPAMTSDDAIEEIRKHWNTFRLTVLRGKVVAKQENGVEPVRPSVMGLSRGLSSLNAELGMSRKGGEQACSHEELSVRFSEMRQSHLRSLTSSSWSSIIEAMGEGGGGGGGEGGDGDGDGDREGLREPTLPSAPQMSESVYSTDRSSRSQSTLSSYDNERYSILNEENHLLKQELLSVKEENQKLREENARLREGMTRN